MSTAQAAAAAVAAGEPPLAAARPLWLRKTDAIREFLERDSGGGGGGGEDAGSGTAVQGGDGLRKRRGGQRDAEDAKARSADAGAGSAVPAAATAAAATAAAATPRGKAASYETADLIELDALVNAVSTYNERAAGSGKPAVEIGALVAGALPVRAAGAPAPAVAASELQLLRLRAAERQYQASVRNVSQAFLRPAERRPEEDAAFADPLRTMGFGLNLLLGFALTFAAGYYLTVTMGWAGHGSAGALLTGTAFLVVFLFTEALLLIFYDYKLAAKRRTAEARERRRRENLFRVISPAAAESVRQAESALQAESGSQPESVPQAESAPQTKLRPQANFAPPMAAAPQSAAASHSAATTPLAAPPVSPAASLSDPDRIPDPPNPSLKSSIEAQTAKSAAPPPACSQHRRAEAGGNF